MKKGFWFNNVHKKNTSGFDDEYTDDYELEEYESEEYESEEYESEEYESEEYDSDEYESEEYESEEYESEEYDSEEYESEEYESEEYESEEYESEEYESEEYESEEYESEEYEPEEYESEEYDSAVASEYYRQSDDVDYAEDTGSYYEYQESYENEEPQYYDGDDFEDEYYDDGEFDTAFRDNVAYKNRDVEYNKEQGTTYTGGRKLSDGLGEAVAFIRDKIAGMSAFDAVLAATGIVVIVALAVSLNMFIGTRKVQSQIAAIAPVGMQLSQKGIVGEKGISAIADAAAAGLWESEETETQTQSQSQLAEDEQSSKVSVSFVSVEKDLKIRFTDSSTGNLITGVAFEVELTNRKSGKKLILTDDDMDGVIYASNVTAGNFDAIVKSTDKYKFPSASQLVVVKDKVEYVVINVQDEVKTEKQVNVSAEDTQKKDALKEEVKLTDTVEWVESSKTPISGSESYLPTDKTTIADPALAAGRGARILFDGLSVSIENNSLNMKAGSSAELKYTSFSDSKDGDVEYKYSVSWKSSDESVATVDNGKVSAKAAGTATITYRVERTTITTTKGKDEVVEISVDDYNSFSDEEKAKCEQIKNENDEITGYRYTKKGEDTTSSITEDASADCTVTVEAAKISSAKLELDKTEVSCKAGESITLQPAKLTYTKEDGSAETITSGFPSIKWSSSDETVAKADQDGKVNALKAGSATITAQISGIKGVDDKELEIKATAKITVSETKKLSVKLDKTENVTVAVGKTITLTATVENFASDSGVTWSSSDAAIATVDEKGVVKGVGVGSVKITATTKEKDADGAQPKAECSVTVTSNAALDTTTKLKDKNGNQVYVKNSDNTYREAVYADYYTASEFYLRTEEKYAYTGWQTINGKTYYYDKNGVPVTGAQIIKGVTYNFGADGAIATAVNGHTFGIDVSRHNGVIDWNAVKASGVDYAIIRCGYRGSATGALITDQNFHTNIKGATAAGIKVGIYVFSQAINEVEAVKEASLAVSLAKGYHLTYPIFIDTESSGGRADKIDTATRTAVVNAFCQTVASAGYQPGIYASKSWYEDQLNMSGIGNYKIWLAQYAAAPTYKGRYDMWQYSSRGTISGIKGNVDLNYSYLGY